MRNNYGHSCVGPQGNTGPCGEKGEKGDVGEQGESGIVPIAHADAIRASSAIIAELGGPILFEYVNPLTSTGFTTYPSPTSQYTIAITGVYHFRFTVNGNLLSSASAFIQGPLLFGLRIFDESTATVRGRYTFRSITEETGEFPSPITKTIYGAGIIHLNRGEVVTIVNLSNFRVQLSNTGTAPSLLTSNSATFSLRLIHPL